MDIDGKEVVVLVAMVMAYRAINHEQGAGQGWWDGRFYGTDEHKAVYLEALSRLASVGAVGLDSAYDAMFAEIAKRNRGDA